MMNNKTVSMYQAANFTSRGYVPCLDVTGFRLVNPNNKLFVPCSEEIFKYYSKELNLKEKTFVVNDVNTIHTLTDVGWKIEDKGLYKDGLSINIEMGL